MTIQSKEFTLYKNILRVLGTVLVLELLLCAFKYLNSSDHSILLAGVVVMLLVCLGLLANLYYRYGFPFEHVGVENMQRIGAQLNAEQRDQLWDKGKVTLHQWDVACQWGHQKNSISLH